MRELILKFAEIPNWAQHPNGFSVYLLARLREAGFPVRDDYWQATVDCVKRGTLLEYHGADCVKYVWAEDETKCARA